MPLVPPTAVVPVTFNTTEPKVKAAPVPMETDPQVSVPDPVTVPVVADVVFATAPVTDSVTPVIVNVALPVKVKEARAFKGATVSRGWLVPTGIITISPADEPGFPEGLQLPAVAHAVPLVPVQV